MSHSIYIFVALLAYWSTITESVLTGKIVSCPGWTLNRHATLKSFLKGGEAEEYEGVTIEWIRGL